MYKCMIGYEYNDRTLDKLLKLRRRYEHEDEQYLSESDAWSILSDITFGLKSYVDKGLVHGDIQPSSLLVLNDRTVKMIDTCMMNDVDSAFHRRCGDRLYRSPMSPQAMSTLSLGYKHATYDTIKNDIWSIGITMLSSLTNDDYNIYYDWINEEILYDVIYDRISHLFDVGYSDDMVQIVHRMLEREEKRRTSIDNIVDSIKRYNILAYETHTSSY